MNSKILPLYLLLFLPTYLVASGSAFLYLEYPNEESGLGLPTLYRGIFKDGKLEPVAVYRFGHRAVQVKVLPTNDGKLWLYDGMNQVICLNRFAPNVEWVFGDVEKIVSANENELVYLTHRTKKERQLRRLDFASKTIESLCSVESDLPWPLSLSPSRKKLLYFRGRKLILRSLKPGKEKVLAKLDALPLLSSKKKGCQALWLSDNDLVLVAKSDHKDRPFALEKWNSKAQRLLSVVIPHKGLAKIADLKKGENGDFILHLGRSYQFDGAKLKVREIKEYKSILLRERPNHFRVKRVSKKPLASQRSPWLFPKERPVNTIGEQLVVFASLSPDGRHSLLGLTDIGGMAVARRCALLDRKSHNLLTVQRGKGPVQPICWLPMGRGLQ